MRGCTPRTKAPEAGSCKLAMRCRSGHYGISSAVTKWSRIVNEWFANPLFWIAWLSVQSVFAGIIFAFGQRWPKVSAGLSMFGGLCGIVALLSLLHLIPIEEIFSGDKNEYIYERLSFNIWLLEMILLIVGLAAAVLAVIGYQSIKAEAIRRAVDEAVRKAVERAEQETREFLKTADISDKKFEPVDSLIQPGSSEEGE